MRVVESTRGRVLPGGPTRRRLVGGVAQEVGVALMGGVIGPPGCETEVQGIVLQNLQELHQWKHWRGRRGEVI